MGKRFDLQGIRGLAILAVLGFHFFPNYFPNGFLGVDQFFVLSGFLMCMLLTKSSEDENISNLQMVYIFYTRRFRRILPLYQLVLFISIIFLYSCFADKTIQEINKSSAQNAMMFISNRMKSDEESYFEKLANSVDIFTHTWSLSVEIQFYIITPLLFFMPFRSVLFYVISLASIGYFCYLPNNFSFFNVFARIWQFMIGMITYELSQKISNEYQLLDSDDCEKQEEPQEERSFEKWTWILASIIVFNIFVVFLPMSLNPLFSRPLITFLTGIVILLSNEDQYLLSNRILVYIGDISYSLYLIHWPIYSYWKLYAEQNQLLLIFSVVIAMLFSIFVYNTFEKWYIKLDNSRVFILTIILIFANIAILKLNNVSISNESTIPQQTNKTIFVNLEDVEKQNREWNANDIINLAVKTCTKRISSKYCNTSGLSPRNPYKILLIGNSWAPNHGNLFYEECKDKANILVLGANTACEPFYLSKEWNCQPKDFDETRKHVENLKPDYIFHITRHIAYGENFNGTSFENDEVYQKMWKEMKKLLKFVNKKVYLLDAIPTVKKTEIVKLVGYLRKNISAVEIDKIMLDLTNYEGARARYAQLIKDCGDKCELIDYHDIFYRKDSKTFRFFDDNGFEYITNILHLTALGLEKVRPIWRKICANL
ncbi:unnamed protein product [Caenorhabditis angaria]|uniref:Acyl_transf_3 domain-containing protein n=1 Tax=Caenorhabditis angaria TaxID=860376 RepID=A0A9P1N0U4_9PELO|nr:unnamed protein product [Caenorhabditis angaria]